MSTFAKIGRSHSIEVPVSGTFLSPELAAAARAFVVEAIGAAAAEAVVVRISPPDDGVTHQVRSEAHGCNSYRAVRGE
ncbi:hypothetical protein [Cupriavidus sp. a3]|uniref:hypothetical protein n=1 Tax=Cupriavidus sp. a3 TaxID=3242158 RepID=UPI003D9C3988